MVKNTQIKEKQMQSRQQNEQEFSQIGSVDLSYDRSDIIFSLFRLEVAANLNLQMPVLNGLSAAITIKQIAPQTRIVAYKQSSINRVSCSSLTVNLNQI
jgi:hypothetical protein